MNSLLLSCVLFITIANLSVTTGYGWFGFGADCDADSTIQSRADNNQGCNPGDFASSGPDNQDETGCIGCMQCPSSIPAVTIRSYDTSGLIGEKVREFQRRDDFFPNIQSFHCNSEHFSYSKAGIIDNYCCYKCIEGNNNEFLYGDGGECKYDLTDDDREDQCGKGQWLKRGSRGGIYVKAQGAREQWGGDVLNFVFWDHTVGHVLYDGLVHDRTQTHKSIVWDNEIDGGWPPACEYCDAGEQRSVLNSVECVKCPDNHYRQAGTSHGCHEKPEFDFTSVQDDETGYRCPENAILHEDGGKTEPTSCMCVQDYVLASGVPSGFEHIAASTNLKSIWYTSHPSSGTTASLVCNKCPMGEETEFHGYPVCKSKNEEYYGQYYDDDDATNTDCAAGTYQDKPTRRLQIGTTPEDSHHGADATLRTSENKETNPPSIEGTFIKNMGAALGKMEIKMWASSYWQDSHWSPLNVLGMVSNGRGSHPGSLGSNWAGGRYENGEFIEKGELNPFDSAHRGDWIRIKLEEPFEAHQTRVMKHQYEPYDELNAPKEYYLFGKLEEGDAWSEIAHGTGMYALVENPRPYKQYGLLVTRVHPDGASLAFEYWNLLGPPLQLTWPSFSPFTDIQVLDDTYTKFEFYQPNDDYFEQDQTGPYYFETSSKFQNSNFRATYNIFQPKSPDYNDISHWGSSRWSGGQPQIPLTNPFTGYTNRGEYIIIRFPSYSQKSVSVYSRQKYKSFRLHKATFGLFYGNGKDRMPGLVDVYGRNEEIDLNNPVNPYTCSDCRNAVLEARDIFSGGSATCAVLYDGTVWLWGLGFQQGSVGLHSWRFPIFLGTGLKKVQTVSLGGRWYYYYNQYGKQFTGTAFACVLIEGGSVKCFAGHAITESRYGQLGYGATTDPGEMGDALPAVDLGAGRRATYITSGEFHTCALLDNRFVKCWGQNFDGQLGYGDESYRGDEPNEMGDALPTVDLGGATVPVTVRLLAVNCQHNCVVLDGGLVKCWGLNMLGQLGYGDSKSRGGYWPMGDALPIVDLGTGRTAASIAVGKSHTCALLDDGSVKCWGDWCVLGYGDCVRRGDYYPGGNAEMGDALPTVDLGTGRTALWIATGRSGFTCALLDEKSLKCWGYNDYGGLGLGDDFPRGSSPDEMGDALPAVDLGTGRTAVIVTMGEKHVCALLDDRSVKCWGNNENGQLGNGVDCKYALNNCNVGDNAGEMGDALVAVELGTGRTAVSIAAGEDHTCAVLDDRSVKCWGDNIFGQLGYGDESNRGSDAEEMGDALPAVALGTGREAVSIAAGYHHTCALLDDGSVKCWGMNELGELGYGDKIWRGRGDLGTGMGDELPAVALLGEDGERTVVSIAAGKSSTCAVLDDGSVKCWGDSDHGVLGYNDDISRGDGGNEMGDALPVVDLGNRLMAFGVQSIAAGSTHTCAVLDDGSVKCWGGNFFGQLGYDDRNDRGDGAGEMGNALPAVALGTGRTAVSIAAGYSHTCALLDDRSMKCWGYNYGQLGYGDTNHRGNDAGEMGDALPAVSLGTGRTAVSIALGSYHTCAVLDDRSVKCWGLNDDGKLGYGDTNRRGDGAGEMGDALPAVELGTGRTAVSIAAGDRHTCALLDDSTVKCWGTNNYWQLGYGDTIYRGDGAGEMGDDLEPLREAVYDYNEGDWEYLDSDMVYPYESSTTYHGWTPWKQELNIKNPKNFSSYGFMITALYGNGDLLTISTLQLEDRDWYSLGKEACKNCEAGSFSAKAGSSTCTLCNYGKYQPDAGKTSCEAAREGRYADSQGLAEDIACDPGFYQNDTEQISCKPAERGYHVPKEAATASVLCEPGHFTDKEGQQFCEEHSKCGFSLGAQNVTAQIAANLEFLQIPGLREYADEYKGWYEFITFSASPHPDYDPDATHNTVCRCEPGFYFGENSNYDLAAKEYYNDDNAPPPPDVPCYPVFPGQYTDDYNMQPEWLQTCADLSIEMEDAGTPERQTVCQCAAGYYRNEGGKGLEYTIDPQQTSAANRYTVDVCTRAQNGRYVSEPGCGGASDCYKTWQSCQEAISVNPDGPSRVDQVPGTDKKDRLCQCKKGYYRTLGGTDLKNNEFCTKADGVNTYVDEVGQSAAKQVRTCDEDHYHENDADPTIVSDRTCKCKIGSYRPNGATGLEPGNEAHECFEPPDGYYVPVAGSEGLTRHSDCPDGSHIYGDREPDRDVKCQCSVGYFGFDASFDVASDNVCQESGVGFMVGVVGQKDPTPCDTEEGYCPYPSNTKFIPYPSCGGSTITEKPDGRNSSHPGECMCKAGYFLAQHGAGWNPFQSDGTIDTDKFRECEPAPVGFIVSSDGATEPSACSKSNGQYQDETAKTSCKSLEDCDSTKGLVKDDDATSNTLGRRCMCDIGFYTAGIYGFNLPMTSECSAPGLNEYLPAGMYGSGEKNLLDSIPCSGDNGLRETDAATSTSAAVCGCDYGYFHPGEASGLSGSDSCDPHLECGTNAIEYSSPNSGAQRLCKCDYGYYRIGDEVFDAGTGSCEEKTECGDTADSIALFKDETTRDRRCQCKPNFYRNEGDNFEAGGTCTPKRNCDETLDGQATNAEEDGDGGFLSDRTCKCKGGHYRPDSFSGLSPGSRCYVQNVCNTNTSTFESSATSKSDVKCRCKSGYARLAGNPFYKTDCPGDCQERDCTELGKCAAPSAIPYGTPDGTNVQCQCAPGYYRSESGFGFDPLIECVQAKEDQYVPYEGSSTVEFKSPCPSSTEEEWKGNITHGRWCRCRPGYYRAVQASKLDPIFNCEKVGSTEFTASYGATKPEKHRSCKDDSTISQKDPTDTSQRVCQCNKGFFSSASANGGTGLSVDSTCQAAEVGFYVPEFGASFQQSHTECGETLDVQYDGTNISDVVCKCKETHYASPWENLSSDAICTERHYCKDTSIEQQGEKQMDSDILCKCASGYYSEVQSTNLLWDATCDADVPCVETNHLKTYTLRTTESATACQCDTGYYIDFVTYFDGRSTSGFGQLIVELRFDSDSVRDEKSGIVFQHSSNSGPNFVSGQYGNALNFEGTSIIQYTATLQDTFKAERAGLTVSFWIRLAEIKPQIAIDVGGFVIIVSPDSDSVLKLTVRNFDLDFDGPVLTVHHWHHICLVFFEQDGSIQAYLNGSSLATKKFDFVVAPLHLEYLSIGNYGNRTSEIENFRGYMDVVKFYDIAFDSWQVALLWQHNRSDVLLDIPQNIDWFAGVSPDYQCQPRNECDDSAEIIWPRDSSEYASFADSLCTCKAGYYRPSFATNFSYRTVCLEPTDGFVSERGQTTYLPWSECGFGAEVLLGGNTTSQPTCQCSPGYFRPEGGSDLPVETDCTAASNLYYVNGKGSNSQTLCPDGESNVGTANVACSACLLHDHFSYCWEPYVTLLETSDGVIRSDEARVSSFAGTLHSGPELYPYCDFIDIHESPPRCLKYPNCPRQLSCDIETLNVTSDLSCHRTEGGTRCNEVENLAEQHHPLFLVQTYDLQYCSGDERCSEYKIDPLLYPEYAVFCESSYVGRQDFSVISSDYDIDAMQHDQYLLEFSSWNCTDLPDHEFLGVGSDFLTTGNEKFRFWDRVWRGKSQTSFATVGLARANVTRDWIQRANPQIVVHHYWGQLQTGLEVAVGDLLVRLLHDKIQIWKIVGTPALVRDISISHLDLATRINPHVSKKLYEDGEGVPGSFCRTGYESGICSAHWTYLRDKSQFPIRFVTSPIREYGTNPDDTVKIMFWDDTMYDLRFDYAEFVSLVTSNLYRGNIQLPLTLRHYDSHSALIPPVSYRQVIPPTYVNDSDFVCKNVSKDQVDTPTGAWLLQFYLETDNVFSDFTSSYSAEISRALRSLVLDSSQGLVFMTSNVYSDAILPYHETIGCNDNVFKALQAVFANMEDVRSSTPVKENSLFMAEGNFFMEFESGDLRPPFYLKYEGVLNFQVYENIGFNVQRDFEVLAKDTFRYQSGEFFIWRDVSRAYPAFDLQAGVQSDTLQSKYHFQPFSPYFLTIQGSNIQKALLYYRQANCSTGDRKDCVQDATLWLRSDDLEHKGWIKWYEIRDYGGLDTKKIPLPLLPHDVYEISLQVVSVKTHYPDSTLTSGGLLLQDGEYKYYYSEPSSYFNSRLWASLKIEKDIWLASRFEMGTFHSDFNLEAHYLPSDTFAHFETGLSIETLEFTFCMTYLPLGPDEPVYRSQGRSFPVNQGLPVKLDDGTESLITYYPRAWEVVNERARGVVPQKLTCVCFSSSGEVYLNGINVSETGNTRVHLGTSLDIGSAPYRIDLAEQPQGVLLYDVSFWSMKLSYEELMRVQTHHLQTYGQKPTVKSPLYDNFLVDRHVRISALGDDEASKPFYFRNFVDDIEISNSPLILDSSGSSLDPLQYTEHCERNGYSCPFLYTRFNSKIPETCDVSGMLLDTSMYAPKESYCGQGNFVRGGKSYISNNLKQSVFRIYGGFYGKSNGLLLIAQLVINVNSDTIPDFNANVISSGTIDFSVSRYDFASILVRACGKAVTFELSTSNSPYDMDVTVSLNAEGDFLIFWIGGQPEESFHLPKDNLCLPSQGEFTFFGGGKRSNVGIYSFLAMSPHNELSRHLQSHLVTGNNCRKKCLVENTDPNTVSVDGEVVEVIADKSIRMMSKIHKKWAFQSDSYLGFMVRADAPDMELELGLKFLDVKITLPFSYIDETHGVKALKTPFLIISGYYGGTNTSLEIQMRHGNPPFKPEEAPSLYSTGERVYGGNRNQRNLHVELKVRGSSLMLYLDGERTYSVDVGQRFPLSELIIDRRFVRPYEDGIYEISDFVILSNTDENCACRSECPVGKYASEDSGLTCFPCPDGSTTFSAGATAVGECKCKPLHKNETSEDGESKCERVSESPTDGEYKGYCTIGSCYETNFSGMPCSCSHDCFVQKIGVEYLPCCSNKCVACTAAVNWDKREYFHKFCKCEYDFTLGIAVNRAADTGCTGFVCGPGQEPVAGHCEDCQENYYKSGVNLEKCERCESCEPNFFRNGCQNTSAGICSKCTVCGNGEEVLQECSTYSDTICSDRSCNENVPVENDAGPFKLVMIKVTEEDTNGCLISPTNRMLECWGSSNYWKGNYTLDERLPVPMSSDMQPIDVKVGEDFICLLSFSGFVQCAGSNTNGQLGMDEGISFIMLTDLQNHDALDFGGRYIKSIALGARHACALDELGSLTCFGLNDHGQLGNFIPGSDRIVDIGAAQTVLQVTCGMDYTCIRLHDDSLGLHDVKCFGNKDNPGTGSLNKELSSGSDARVELGSSEAAIDVQAYGSHTCVRFLDGTVKCFGGRDYGVLGYNLSPGEDSSGLSDVTMGRNLPSLFDSGNAFTITQMALTQRSTCFLTSSGKVVCMGSKAFTGYRSETPPHGNILNNSYPTSEWFLENMDEGVVEIFAFDEAEVNCALTRNQTVYCWNIEKPFYVLTLPVFDQLCKPGYYSTRCRTNDYYSLLFSRGFLTRRTPLGRKMAAQYGIITECRPCTTNVDDCDEGFYLDEKCDGTTQIFKDNRCLPCSEFRCADKGSQFVLDVDCGVKEHRTTRFADSIVCSGSCEQVPQAYQEHNCNT